MGTTMPWNVDWPVVEEAYDLWTRHGDIDRAPTRAEANVIVSHLFDTGLVEEATRHTRNDYRGRVISWFTRRDVWSPVVDEVAVARLLSGDSTVWAGMTNRERLAAAQAAGDGPITTPDMSVKDRDMLNTWIGRARTMRAESAAVAA